MLLMEVSKCWKTVELPKILIEKKSFKIFYMAQAARRRKEIIQSSPQIKGSYVPRTKISLGKLTGK